MKILAEYDNGFTAIYNAREKELVEVQHRKGDGQQTHGCDCGAPKCTGWQSATSVWKNIESEQEAWNIINETP